jgi:peroxiredoxin
MNAVFVLGLALVSAGTFTDAANPSIGKKIDSFKLRDYRGAEKALDDWSNRKLLVVAFLGCDCPLAKLYGPRLAQLARDYESKGVAFIGISSNQQDSISAIGQYAKQSGIHFSILKDVHNVIADQFGAQRTPEVFVLDTQRVVRYRGRVDDQYGIGFVRAKVGRRDLAEALDELLAGKAVAQPLTQAPGCFIGRMQPEEKRGSITYSKHIAPVLQKNCVECHHPGEIAPFSLTSYEETVGWTETIREVVEQGRMPPWHADPRYGHFSNDRRLPAADKKLILEWIENGAPGGDPRDLPKPAEYVEGWRIPRPDVVITLPKEFKVPAEGTVPYQYFVVNPGFTEDKWVKAAEVRPQCRAVVHHVLVFVQPPGQSGMGRRRGFASNWLAGTVPGAQPLVLPEGQAKRIPAGSRLLFQIHYTPNGAPQVDRPSLGLVFADPSTVRQEVSTEMAANPRLVLPPNTDNIPIESTEKLTEDTVLLSLMPHTHLRGKSFQYEAIYPDGKKEILLDLPHYDFNWQNTYMLSEPKLLPKGTEIHCVAHYDNSKNNPSNPNPNDTVHWGEQTWEEMMIGYFDRTTAGQDLLKNPVPRPTVAARPKLVLDPELSRLAEKALDSQEAFEAFAAATRKAFPKIDRVCFTTFTEGKLRVERAAYPGEVKSHIAETGFEKPARGFALAGYALFNASVLHTDLKQARGMDMSLMSQTFGSSFHAPVAVDGKPGTINFWSKEKNAFKDSETLQALADVITGHR